MVVLLAVNLPISELACCSDVGFLAEELASSLHVCLNLNQCQQCKRQAVLKSMCQHQYLLPGG